VTEQNNNLYCSCKLTQALVPHGAVTNYAYTNSPPTVTATTNLHWVKTTMDGFGRTIKVERGHNGGGGGTKTIVETEYEPCACSPFGKVKRVSLPYAPGGSVLWTTYTYDGLGRTVAVAQPNASGTSTYLYEGNAVTVTDAAGKWRKYESDAFGSVTKTVEPNPAGGANWETSYAYDMLGRRTSLTMTRGATTQTRTWNYVGWTGRLSSEVHPETGTTSYTYHADGKLSRKTLASGKFVMYAYDGYGRLSTVTDSTSTCNGATFYYDEAGKNAIGRLSKIRYSGVACTLGQYNPPGYDFIEEYWYTAGGLATKKRVYLQDLTRQYTSEQFDLNYTYNNEGQLSTENLYLGTAGYYPYSRGYYYDRLGPVIGRRKSGRRGRRR
jgi:YD repeat-containing protein